MGKTRITWIFYAALLWPSVASAEPRVTSTVEYYDVAGTTVDALRQSKRSHGPFWLAGLRRTDAMTKNTINWRYDRIESEDNCSLDKPEVEVQTLTTLPRWTDHDRASAALRETWDRYLAALKIHETGHAMITLQIAKRIEAALKALPAYESCDDLDREVNHVSEALLDSENSAQEAYDDRTHHGETQGVRLH